VNKICVTPALAVVILALNPGSTGSAQAPAGSFPAVTEELIAEKDAAAPEDDSEDMVSADGRHVAWRSGREKKWGVMLDGQRLAVVGSRGGKLIVTVDLKEGPPFDVIGGLSFSPDGRHVSYAGADIKTGFGGDKGLGRAVIDGQPGPQFAAIVTTPRFSPDAKRIAYAARRAKDDEVVIVDGQPGPRFPSIVAGPQFCNDGRHVAYIVSDAGGKFLVVDGERVGAALLSGADFTSDLTFAPDGRRVGYVATAGSIWGRYIPAAHLGSRKAVGRNAKRRVYVEGQPGPEYDTQGVSGLRFTPDSRHFIYVVHGLQEGSRKVSFVVTNRTEAKRYDAVWTRTLGVQDTGAVVYLAQSGRKFLRVTHPIQ